MTSPYRCGVCAAPATWREVHAGLRACDACAEACSEGYLWAPWGPAEREEALADVWRTVAERASISPAQAGRPDVTWRTSRVVSTCAACCWRILPGERKVELAAGAGRLGRMTVYLCEACAETCAIRDDAPAACPF